MCSCGLFPHGYNKSFPRLSMPLPDDSFNPEIARTIYGQPSQGDTEFETFISVAHGEDDPLNLINEILAIGLRIRRACKAGMDLGEGHTPDEIEALVRSRFSVLKDEDVYASGSVLERLNQIREQLLPFEQMAASFLQRETRP